MKEFLSKRLKQFKNLLSTKKFKIRKIRSIAIVLIATITFTTLGSNFVYAKNNEVYERNLIAANNDPSVIEAIQNNREVYNSSKIDKFVVADNYMTYATILGKNGAVFFDGTDHLNEAGQCKDGCKAMIATATFIRGTKPGTEEAKYCISYYIACLNCSRNKAQQIGLESYTNPSEKERLSNNSKELKGLFNGMDKYFAEHPEESPIPKINVPKDVINKIKSNRKFVLDNGIFVKENGQNVTANASVEDAIDVNENGICNSGNHRRTYDHYTHKGADLLVRHGCFDCLYESFKVVPKSEYDTLEKRIKLANDSVRIKQFFIDNGLSFEQEKQSFKPNGESIQKGEIVWDTTFVDTNMKWYNISYTNNNVVSILTEVNGNEKAYCNLLYDISSKRIQVKVFDDGITEFDVRFTDDGKLVLINRKTSEVTNLTFKSNKGSFQEATLAITAVGTTVMYLCAILLVVDTNSLGNSLAELGNAINNTFGTKLKDFVNSLKNLVAKLAIPAVALTLTTSIELELESDKPFEEKKLFFHAIGIKWFAEDNKRVYFINPIPMNYEDAVEAALEGEDIITFDKRLAELVVDGVILKDPSFKKLHHFPHFETSRVLNGPITYPQGATRQEKDEIRYARYLANDPYFSEANRKGYYAHYHAKKPGSNIHSFYFSTGQPADMLPAFLEFVNRFNETFRNVEQRIIELYMK